MSPYGKLPTVQCLETALADANASVPTNTSGVASTSIQIDQQK